MTQPPKGKGPWDFTLSTLLALPPQSGQCLFNPDRITFWRQGRCAELFARHGFQVAPRDAHRCGRRQGWMGAGWEGGKGRAGKGREGVKAGGSMEGLGADFPAPGNAVVSPRGRHTVGQAPGCSYSRWENCPGSYRTASGASRCPTRAPVPGLWGPGTPGLAGL